MREFSRTYRTAYNNLNNGQPAALYSNHDQQVIDTHFRWMQQYGCDTAALQRFNPTGGEGPIRDAITVMVSYVMYDVTNWTGMQSEIKADWTNKMSAYTASSAYARQNGKPVVCIWGFGFNDGGRPFSPEQCQDVVNWFKGQGVYLIGGVPTWWRTGGGDSRPGFLNVYRSFNMPSPWMVGRIGNAGDSDHFHNVANAPDQADCDAHGDFMWRQFYNQIAKTAENASMVPSGSGLRALDEDGTPCSADYYLRLTRDGGRMLKREIPTDDDETDQPDLTSPSASGHGCQLDRLPLGHRTAGRCHYPVMM